MRTVLAEADLALRRRWLTASFLAVFQALALAVPSVADTLATARSVDELERLSETGYLALVVSTVDDGRTDPPLSTRACSYLRTLTGVRGAGAVRSIQGARKSGPRGSPIAAWYIDGGLAQALDSDDGRGVARNFLSPATLEIGSRPEATFWIDGASLVVQAQEIDAAALGAGMASSLVLVRSEVVAADACIILADHQSRGRVAEEVALGFSPVDGYSVGWASPESGIVEDPVDGHASRSTRRLWLLSAPLSLLVFGVYLLARRGEAVVFRIFGLRSVEVMLIEVLQMWLILSVATAIACLASVPTIRAAEEVDPIVYWGPLIGSVGLSSLVAMALSVIQGTVDPVSELRG